MHPMLGNSLPLDFLAACSATCSSPSSCGHTLCHNYTFYPLADIDTMQVSENLTVDAVDVGPSGVAITEALNFHAQFHSTHPISSGTWRIAYVVDVVGERHVLDLVSKSCDGYPTGEGEWSICIDTSALGEVKPEVISNAGLLSVHYVPIEHAGKPFAELADVAVMSINAIVMIQPSPDVPGTFIRLVFNPLDM